MKPCKHGHMGAMHLPCYKCRTEHLEVENANLKAALSRLVELKRYKDANGNDAHYEKEQQAAWAQAGLTLMAPWSSDLLMPSMLNEKADP
ncbi:MAG: hypothetical protein IPK48_07890 [Gammaproteobacteria bacterium]|nr:hypothetical protein [Gammaproteobacteria bacterium]